MASPSPTSHPQFTVTGVFGLSGPSAAQPVALAHRTERGSATTLPLNMEVIIALESLPRRDRVWISHRAPSTASGMNGQTGPSAL